jgi:hypothetical protein
LLPRGIPPKQLKVEKRMKLRCQDGDIAVITWDYPGCLKNIGRLVQVQGPVRKGECGPAWRIRPITENLYAFLDLDGSIGHESVTWGSRIDHPDAWMIPIRPKTRPEARSISEPLKLTEPTAAPIHQAPA